MSPGVAPGGSADNRFGRVLMCVLSVVALLAGCSHSAGRRGAFGDDHFGHWVVDRFGLPAFDYTANEVTDPAARWDDGTGVSTAFWHQVGNDRVVADAFNDGYVQLWDGEREYRWSNYYDSGLRQYAGGFGYVRVGGSTWSTLYPDRPAGSSYQRRFGMGYFEKVEKTNGVQVDQTVFAPFGDRPVLLSQVELRNTGTRPETVHYTEFWGVNPVVVPPGFTSQGPSTPQAPRTVRYSPATRSLLALPPRGPTPPTPHALFLSSLTDPVAGYETSTSRFFGAGDRRRPAELVAGRLSDRPESDGRQAMFALQATVRLPPGRAHALVYAYGYDDPAAIPGLLAQLSSGARTALRSSQDAWRAALPVLAVPVDRWLQREVAWNYYYLRSSETREDVWGLSAVNQGSAYEYYWGLDIAYRDIMQAALPLTLLAPQLARQTVLLGLRAQRASGDIPYGFARGRPFDLAPGYRADDADLWLLWTTSQYVLGTRDFALLRQREPYFESRTAGTVLQHLELALQHLWNTVGFGRHGEIRMLSGDWADGEGAHGATESTATTAQAAWVLGSVAAMAGAAGLAGPATRAAADAATLRSVVARQWTGHWFNRGYRGQRPYGVDSLYLNAQPWALLAGAATDRRTASVTRAIRSLLSDPSPIGAASQSTSQGYGPRRERATGSGTTGGIWFALNGIDVWALARADPALAYDEYTKNTRAAYAHAYPDNWFGVLSGPDSYSSFESKKPGEPAIPFYPVQDSLSSLWQLYDTSAEAGIEATAAGYTIDPHWPFRHFTWNTRLIGVRYSGGAVNGYVRAAADGDVRMRVRTPDGEGSHLTLLVDGHPSDVSANSRFAQWSLRLRAGRQIRWTLTRR